MEVQLEIVYLNLCTNLCLWGLSFTAHCSSVSLGSVPVNTSGVNNGTDVLKQAYFHIRHPCADCLSSCVLYKALMCSWRAGLFFSLFNLTSWAHSSQATVWAQQWSNGHWFKLKQAEQLGVVKKTYLFLMCSSMLGPSVQIDSPAAYGYPFWKCMDRSHCASSFEPLFEDHVLICQPFEMCSSQAL